MTELTAQSECDELLDLRGERDDPLMERFYQDVYLPAFPIPSEREDPTLWRDYLYGARRDGPFEVHFLIAGSGLRQPAARTICGGFIFVIYPRSGCVLLTYLVVDPRRRGQGLARRLFEAGLAIVERWAAERGQPVRAILGEINDPRRVAAERDVLDPWARLAIFERLGGRVVDVSYVQPELIPGQGRCDDLLLVAFPRPGHSNNALPTAPLRDFLLEFYPALGVQNPAADPDLQRTLRALERPSVALLRPSSLRPLT